MSIKLLRTIFRGLRPFSKAKAGALLAFAMGASALPLSGQYFVSIELERPEGTYVAGDPVPMTVTVVNTAATTICAAFVVDVHLTQDTNLRTDKDHLLTQLPGPPLGPGQSYTWNWVQQMPGHFEGTFFVNAEAYTLLGTPCYGRPNAATVQAAKITLLAQNHPETGRVSISDAGVSGNGPSEAPSISQDGRWVTFSSVANTLLGGTFQGDGDDAVFVSPINNDVADIFLRDQWTGEIERVTRPVSGNDPDGESLLPRLSADADARWIAFQSQATNLVAGQDTNGLFDVFLYDRESEQIVLVSRALDGNVGNGVSRDASVSADGRWVAFESEATNLVANDTNNLFDIFVADMHSGEKRRVNVTNFGGQASGGESRRPRISADGRHIVFESRATNFASGGKAGVREVYVHDRDANETGLFDETGGIATIRLSVNYDLAGSPVYSDGNSFGANLSPDGRFVTFSSGATTLFSEPATGSIFLNGRPAEATVLFAENTPAQGNIAFVPDVSATGSLEFTANPSGGDSVQISDGVSNRTFEFAELNVPVGGGNTRVFLGANATSTRNTMVGTINNAFLTNGEQTLRAAAGEINGNPAVLLTNLVQGEAGNNQPIDDANAPTLNVVGIDGATVTQPAAGETLVIDNNQNAPVTIEFYAAGDVDPTDLGARILGVELGRTAKETSLNLLAVFQGLGYDQYDVPALPSFFVSSLLENPEDGDLFTFTRGEGDDQEELVFRFVQGGAQFDPNNPEQVRIGQTAAETRGNLIRGITAVFTFDPLPAVIESTNEAFVIGGTLTDSAATGSIEITQMPEDGYYVEIGDGFGVRRFRFDDEREQTEEETEDEIPVPPFEAGGGNVVRVYLVEDMTLQAVRDRLFAAIQASLFNLTATQAGPVIQLLDNQVGDAGNVAIAIAPVLTEEEIENEEEPWALVEGMDGGAISSAIVDGERVVFYPDNLLHPRVVFEFRQDLGQLSADANHGVQLGATGSETEGNFLAVLFQSGLPRLKAVEGDPELPSVVLNSEIGGAGGLVAFDFSPSNAGSFGSLTGTDGQLQFPLPGGTVTIDDQINPPAVFEFSGDGTAAEGNIPVLISTVASVSRDNLIVAINGFDGVDVAAVDASAGGEIRARLLRTRTGPIGTPLAVGSDLGPWVAVVDVIDGQLNPVEGEAFVVNDGVNPATTFEFVLDVGNLSEAGRQAVLIDADRNETRDNLLEAIKDSGLRILAIEASEDGNPGMRLTHFSSGAVGNFPINVLTADASFTVKGMTGGGSSTEGVDQVYLVDRDANANGRFDQVGQSTLELISKTPLGTAGNDLSGDATVTADGRFVAFRTQANDLLPLTVTRSDGQVFTNIEDPRFLLEADIEGNSRNAGLDLTSEIARLTDGDNYPDIYVYDRQEGTHRRVSVNRFGEGLFSSVRNVVATFRPQASRRPAVSADGRFIVFESDAEPWLEIDTRLAGDQQVRGGGYWHGISNRATLGGNTTRDVYIHDQRFPSSGIQFEGTVALEEPVSPISVGTGVSLRATVSDLEAGRTVANVQFFANGVPVGTADAPIVPNGIVGADTRFFDFSVVWTPALEDSYTLTARATDSRGRLLPVSNVVQASVHATVANPPTVAIVSPTPLGVTFVNNQSSFPFMAQVFEGSSIVDRVALFLRGVFIGDASRLSDGEGLWRLDFNLAHGLLDDGTPLSPGLYGVTALAFDGNGNSASAPGGALNVVNAVETPSSAPLLTVSSPVIGRGQSVLLRAEAGDDGSALQSVAFYSNGQLIGVSGADGDGVVADGASFRLTWTPLTTGTKHIYAIGVDVTGQTVVSDVINVEVRPVDGFVPTVAVSIPTEAATVTNLSSLGLGAIASASSGRTISSVEFFLSGESLGLAESPGSLEWLLFHHFNDARIGVHDLVAMATDSVGNVSVSAAVEITVTGAVNDAALEPQLAVSSPRIGRGQDVFLTVRANDDGASLQAVTFFANGLPIGEGEGDGDGDAGDGEAVGANLFQLTWTPNTVGSFRVFAVGLDVWGNSVVSNVREVEVHPVDGVVPSVSILSPDEDVEVTNVSTWRFAAVASASAGRDIDSVEFFLGGESIGQASRVARSEAATDQGMPRQVQWLLHETFDEAQLGAQSLVAIATDSAGNVSVSAPVEVTVVGATSAAPGSVFLSVSGGSVLNSGERVFTRNQIIQLRAQVVDSDGRVESVTFFRNGILWEEADETSNPVEEEPFTYTGPVTGAGVFEVYAVATDDTGNTTVSAVHIITSFPEADAFARITSPLSGSIFIVGQQGDLLTGAQPIPIQVDYRLPGGVAVNDVTLFINGVELTAEEQVRRRLTQSSLRTEWLANLTGELSISAVVTDSRGNVWQADAVTITVAPLGVVIGNPSEPENNLAFVTQSFLDVLDQAPSRALLQFYTSRLEAGDMTRGEVIAQLMDHPDFRLKRWVIVTYLTALGDFPTVEQLEAGVLLLGGVADGGTGGDDGGTGGDGGFGGDDGDAGGDGEVVVGEEIPTNLPILINYILDSDEFWLRHGESGLLMRPTDLVDVIWEDNLGRSWRTFSQRQGQLALLDPDLADGGTLLGPELWIAQLIIGPPDDFSTVISVNSDGTFRRFDSLARRGALILTLLDRDIRPGDVEVLSSNIAEAAEFVLTGLHNQYSERFEGRTNFFGLQAPSLNPTKVSPWLGTFDDRNFSYATGMGWIDHKEHGWLYVSGVGYPGGMWTWDNIQADWLWTRHDRYPFFYKNMDQTWLFYKVGGNPSARQFFFYNLNGWLTVPQS